MIVINVIWIICTMTKITASFLFVLPVDASLGASSESKQNCKETVITHVMIHLVVLIGLL